MTSYDDIYTTFININKTDSSNLPTNDTDRYDIIHTGIKYYNSTMNNNIICNDSTEEISVDLTDNEILILAHCIKHMFLDNQLTYYITMFKPFTKEIGYSNYQTDVKALEALIDKEDKVIDQLIENQSEDFMD